MGICLSPKRENTAVLCDLAGTKVSWTITFVSKHKARLPETTLTGMALPLGQKPTRAL